MRLGKLSLTPAHIAAIAVAAVGILGAWKLLPPEQASAVDTLIGAIAVLWTPAGQKD
jgi:hypothetical protein